MKIDIIRYKENNISNLYNNESVRYISLKKYEKDVQNVFIKYDSTTQNLSISFMDLTAHSVDFTYHKINLDLL